MNARTLLLVLISVCVGFVLAGSNGGPERKSYADAMDAAQVPIDDSKVVAQYANFCRITPTPEELFIDYGFNSQPSGMPKQPIAVGPRVVMNYYTAKRMLQVLERTIQRHEATFGPLETDVRKRIKSDASAENGEKQ
jgi:hypothetical protein